MRPSVFVKPISQANRSLFSICCCFLIMAVLWLGVCLDNKSVALAESSQASALQARPVEMLSGAIASRPDVLENLKDRVKNDLSDEKSKSATGQPKRTFDNSAKQIDSTGNEVDGRTQENVAKIQGKATDSGHGVENVIEDVMSNIKDKVN
ncbi:MAG: hypothetical protein HC781_12900 [Leptolyngbyaceae cyanobacterium CSU_1_4]|nr:hypothetical protein [Leptolyngbyaceae cyanobacterium CSU_1_4]